MTEELRITRAERRCQRFSVCHSRPLLCDRMNPLSSRGGLWRQRTNSFAKFFWRSFAKKLRRTVIVRFNDIEVTDRYLAYVRVRARWILANALRRGEPQVEGGWTYHYLHEEFTKRRFEM
jgi:hypothetical protein